MRLSLSDQILNNHLDERSFVRKGKPRWLRMQLPRSEKYSQLVRLVRDNRLHTVCQEASCPNMGECWSNGVATMMILGDTCTRSCGFCHIKTGRPGPVDADEPRRVAEAIAIMNLRYVVITSVDRDELADGGSTIWAETIRQTRLAAPQTQIEVLIPDFQGVERDVLRVVEAGPNVVAHNMETVRRLHPAVRPQAKYARSIGVLRTAKQAGAIIKTGFMVGLGERDEEIPQLMQDVIEGTTVSQSAGSGVGHIDIMSIGQYLQPSPQHLPVHRFVHPDQFAEYKRIGEAMGVTHIESGPMVRSSYHADQQAASAEAACRG